MLDIKLIRSEPDLVKEAMQKRGKAMDSEVDKILSLDKLRRDLLTEVESMKAEQNRVSKEIPVIKKAGGDASDILSQMKTLSDKIKDLDGKVSQLEDEQKIIVLNFPNIPHQSVPVGKDESDNVEIRRWGDPRSFDFEPLPHWELGAKLGILDPERAAKVTGARFHFYKGFGARLERAVINFFLDTHTQNGYTEVLPPFMANRASMIGTGQLPKFEEDAFKVQDTDYFLIPTAEVPVTNLYRDEILSGEVLPLRYCAYSACFRSEAGSAGRDTRGLIRQHQFNKVELVKFTEPENSYEELESLTKDAEGLLQALGLPYRTIVLCTGDMGFSSAKTYDIEVYMPSYNGYREISSCSDFEDFQARRANIRHRKSLKDKPRFLHTLNGSGLAVGRTVAAILENCQNADGSVTVPEVLRSYMGRDKITENPGL